MPRKSCGRLIVARLQQLSGRESIDERYCNVRSDLLRPSCNCYINKFDEDPFHNPSLVGTTDDTRVHTERADIEDMLNQALDNALPASHWCLMKDLVLEFAQTFSTKLSATPAKVELFRLSLPPGARPIRLKPRNHKSAHCELMSKLMKEIVSKNVIYASPSSKWACAAVVVPKHGFAWWRFTVDLSSAKKNL